MPRLPTCWRVLLLILPVVAACSGNDDPPAPPVAVAFMQISPSPTSVDRGAQLQLVALLYGPNGEELAPRPVTWTSGDTTIARITPAGGLVTGVENGEVIIRAAREGVTAETPLLVLSGEHVTQVTVTPGSRTVLAGSVVGLHATPRNAAGDPILAPINISWISLNAGTATFDGSVGPVIGDYVVATFGTLGTGQINATADVTSFLTYEIAQASWVSVSAGRFYSCGVTTAQEAYCWGDGEGGHLGTGSTNPEQVPTRIAGPVLFDSVSAGSAITCGLAMGAAYCWGSVAYTDPVLIDTSLPIEVTGMPALRAISVGEEFACALAPSGAVWCWGVNRAGQLGRGNTTSSWTPAVVSGGILFNSITASRDHACALTGVGAAWCWGNDQNGQLGDAATANCAPVGDPTAKCSSSPVAVSGASTFRSISAGANHTCGIAADYTAWCWGGNAAGQLGTGAAGADQPTPVAVSGGMLFGSITAGDGFTCAIDLAGHAWCWGSNDFDQLGTDGGPSRSAPTAVTTTERFLSLDAGDRHTCGWTVADIGWCWGDNVLFELGSGRPKFVKVPIRLPG